MKNYLHAAFFSFVVGSPLVSVAQSVTVEPPKGENICLFSSLDLSNVTYFKYSGEEGTTGARANQSTFGKDIVLKDTLYTTGVGVHAPSKAVFEIKGATRFVANLGVDDAAANKPNHGIVDYVISVFKDKQKTELKRGTIKRTDAASTKIDVEVAGNDYLVLDLQQGANNWADQASWANAYFEYAGEKPTTIPEGLMYMENVVELPTVGQDGAQIIPLSTLDISKATCGWGTIQSNKSIDGNPLRLGGKVYRSGVGTHAPSQIIVKLNGAVTRFETYVGIDEEVKVPNMRENAGIADYRVSLKGGDGNVVVVKEGTIDARDAAPVHIDVDCNGWKYMFLEAFPGKGEGDSDHVDWANAYFEFHEKSTAPPVIVEQSELDSKLACATVTFSQPNVRYMHKIRSSSADAVISVSNLPEGLQWNEKRSLVEGVVKEEGVYHYNISLEADGETEAAEVTLNVSSKLQQPVPLMGWLSWNVVEGEISEEVVKTTADAMVKSGLLEAGYNYLVMDDIWHAKNRAADGKPLPDARKFPNGIAPVADYVHSKGLKFGIYSDAAEKTCAGCYGSLGYETIDANQYAEWGVDLLKYDYCFAPTDQQTALERYKAMGDALKASGRDILFYMCEWGQREPWKWGHETGATCWRCTYDTRDGWNGQTNAYGVGIGILQSIRDMKSIWAYSGPNRFNDADMMCVGIHGTGKASSQLVDKVGMTQDEYRTQFALWCMWSSPLTLSFDLRKPITDDDLSIMTHDEFIALDQDRMGQQAELISDKNDMFVLAKDLENGDVAISVTNLSNKKKAYSFDFSQIGALDVNTEYFVRDLWFRKDLGTCRGGLDTEVASHATKVFRLSKKDVTGVQSIANDDVKVTVKNGQLVVNTGKENVQNKRILVSDMIGRIVASASGTGSEFVLSLNEPLDICVVNIACGGKAHSVKVKL